jgi:hypothetical protein
MNAEERESLNALVESVIGACYEVGNTLRAGFLEKVYERALVQELAIRGLKAQQHAAFPVRQRLPGRRVLRRSPGRRPIDRRVEMRGAVLERAHGAVHQLLKSIRHQDWPAGQFSAVKSPTEANRLQLVTGAAHQP